MHRLVVDQQTRNGPVALAVDLLDGVAVRPRDHVDGLVLEPMPVQHCLHGQARMRERDLV
jgi:hypothetical protein